MINKTNKTYILPTRFGVYFLVVIFILFILALSFGNALALFAAIFFASIAMTSSIYTHFNLENISFITYEVPVLKFSGERFNIKVKIENRSSSQKFGISVYLKNNRSNEPLLIGQNKSVLIEIPMILDRRGQYHFSKMGIDTTYPFGIFRAWKKFEINLDILVAPSPKGNEKRPHVVLKQIIEVDEKNNTVNNRREWFDFRTKYNPGDNYRDIDWKLYARERGLYKKEYKSSTPQMLELNTEKINAMDFEMQLEQISKWCLELFHSGIPYSLKVEENYVSPNSGIKQLKRCLDLLSTIKKEDP